MKNTLIMRNPEIVARIVGKKIFAYNPDKNILIKLNPTATQIWLLLDKAKTKTKLIRSIIESFDTYPPEAQNDLDQFIQNALDNKLLVTV